MGVVGLNYMRQKLQENRKMMDYTQEDINGQQVRMHL